MSGSTFHAHEITERITRLIKLNDKIEFRKRWIYLGVNFVKMCKLETMRKLHIYYAAKCVFERNIRRKFFNSWKLKTSWKHLASKIVSRCNRKRFKHINNLLKEQKVKLRVREWKILTKKLIDLRNDNLIVEAFLDKHDIYLVKELFARWRRYCASNVGNDGSLQHPVNRKRIRTDVSKSAYLRDRWISFYRCMVTNSILTNIERTRRVDSLRNSWNDLVVKKKIHMMGLIKRCYDKKKRKLQRRRSEMKALRENMREKWRDISKRNLAKTNQSILKAGHLFIEKNRRKNLERKMLRRIILSWSIVRKYRKAYKYSFVDSIEAFSLSCNHSAAFMIQNFYRGTVLGIIRRRKLRDLHRVFYLWKSVKLVKDSMHITFPELTEEFEAPGHNIELSDISKLVDVPGTATLDRLGDVHQMHEATVPRAESSIRENPVMGSYNEDELKQSNNENMYEKDVVIDNGIIDDGSGKTDEKDSYIVEMGDSKGDSDLQKELYSKEHGYRISGENDLVMTEVSGQIADKEEYLIRKDGANEIIIVENEKNRETNVESTNSNGISQLDNVMDEKLNDENASLGLISEKVVEHSSAFEVVVGKDDSNNGSKGVEDFVTIDEDKLNDRFDLDMEKSYSYNVFLEGEIDGEGKGSLESEERIKDKVIEESHQKHVEDITNNIVDTGISSIVLYQNYNEKAEDICNNAYENRSMISEMLDKCVDGVVLYEKTELNVKERHYVSKYTGDNEENESENRNIIEEVSRQIIPNVDINSIEINIPTKINEYRLIRIPEDKEEDKFTNIVDEEREYEKEYAKEDEYNIEYYANDIEDISRRITPNVDINSIEINIPSKINEYRLIRIPEDKEEDKSTNIVDEEREYEKEYAKEDEYNIEYYANDIDDISRQIIPNFDINIIEINIPTMINEYKNIQITGNTKTGYVLNRNQNATLSIHSTSYLKPHVEEDIYELSYEEEEKEGAEYNIEYYANDIDEMSLRIMPNVDINSVEINIPTKIDEYKRIHIINRLIASDLIDSNNSLDQPMNQYSHIKPFCPSNITVGDDFSGPSSVDASSHDFVDSFPKLSPDNKEDEMSKNPYEVGELIENSPNKSMVSLRDSFNSCNDQKPNFMSNIDPNDQETNDNMLSVGHDLTFGVTNNCMGNFDSNSLNKLSTDLTNMIVDSVIIGLLDNISGRSAFTAHSLIYENECVRKLSYSTGSFTCENPSIQSRDRNIEESKEQSAGSSMSLSDPPLMTMTDSEIDDELRGSVNGSTDFVKQFDGNSKTYIIGNDIGVYKDDDTEVVTKVSIGSTKSSSEYEDN